MALQFSIQTESAQHTQSVAAALARELRPGDVVALEGELGAGKTVFVRGLAEGLGMKPSAVSSPTFVIRHEYVSTRSDLPTLVHIDAYRLSGPDELETIGWSELLDDADVILAVEWPSRIAAALPADRIDISIEHSGMNSRLIRFNAPQAWRDRLNAIADQGATAMRSFKCRKCGGAIAPDAPQFPFCSSRCRLAELGTWFNEGYRLSRPAQEDDELEE